MSNTKSQTEVVLTRDGQAATIRFVSSAGVNILSSRVISALGSVVQRLAEDAHTRFVVIRGEGRAFIAGADIREMQTFDEDRGRAFAVHGHEVFDALEALPQVTIAALTGHALGGGCELALACDFRLIVNEARIGQPETRLGLIPGWGGTLRLPRLVGSAHARRLIFSGDGITAQEALRIGLVDEVVKTAEEMDNALHRWFKLLSAASPAAIARAKRALTRHDEIEEFSTSFSCSDSREGMAAFVEKRPPAWADGATG